MIPAIKHKYSYEGAVMNFDRCVASNWHGETYAETPQKALNNLRYQYRKQNNLVPNTNITLPGKLTRWED